MPSWVAPVRKAGEVITEAFLDKLVEGITLALEGGGGGGGYNPLVSLTGVVYMSPEGDDENGGGSWVTPVKTVKRALELLPVSGEGTAMGIIQCATGLYELAGADASSRRESSCEVVGGTVYIQDLTKTATIADKGKSLVNPWLGEAGTAGSALSEWFSIEDVWEGKVNATTGVKELGATGKIFFTTNNQQGVTKTLPLFIMKPAFQLPAGVTLRGQGSRSGTREANAGSFPTRFKDTGNGILCLGPSGAELAGNSQPMHLRIEHIAFEGNNTSLYGFFGWNVYDLALLGVSAEHFRCVGLMPGTMFNSQIEDVYCTLNGTQTGEISATVKEVLGFGLRCPEGTAVGMIENILCLGNWGVGAELCGCHGVSVCTSHTGLQKTTGGAEITNTGTGLLIRGGVATSVDGGWQEGNAKVNTRIIGGAPVTIRAMHFQGDAHGPLLEVTKTAIGVIQGSGPLVFESCEWQKHVTADIEEAGSHPPLIWKGCVIQTTGGPGTFIKRSGGLAAIPETSATTSGEINVTHISSPPGPTSVTLVSGTPWQNTTGGDVRMTIQITNVTGSSVQTTRGPTSPGNTRTTPAAAKLTSDMTSGGTVFPLSGAAAAGWAVGMLITFTKVTASRGVTKEKPYFIVASTAIGIEIANEEGGTPIATSGGSIIATNTEVAPLRSTRYAAAGETAITDLYVPDHAWLTVMLSKGATLPVAAEAQPA